jgi:type II secretory pathway pseudopilin PulG
MKILPKRAEAGTSLIEVVVATGILAIMAAGILNSYGYGFFVTKLVRENQRATQIMLEKVEIIRLYNWDQVNTAGFIPNTFTDVYDPQAPAGQQGITYNGTVTIGAYPGSSGYGDKIRQVVVTVSWNTDGRVPHSRTLATLIAQDGEQNYVW